MEIMCQERIMSKGFLEEIFLLGWITNPIRDNKFIRKILKKRKFYTIILLILGTWVWHVSFNLPF